MTLAFGAMRELDHCTSQILHGAVRDGLQLSLDRLRFDTEAGKAEAIDYLANCVELESGGHSTIRPLNPSLNRMPGLGGMFLVRCPAETPAGVVQEIGPDMRTVLIGGTHRTMLLLDIDPLRPGLDVVQDDLTIDMSSEGQGRREAQRYLLLAQRNLAQVAWRNPSFRLQFELELFANFEGSGEPLLTLDQIGRLCVVAGIPIELAFGNLITASE